MGVALAARLGLGASVTAEELRSLPAPDLLAAAQAPGAFRTRPVQDGVVFPESVEERFAAGRHVDVPVIVGSTQDEGTTLWAAFAPSTLEDLRSGVASRYGTHAEAVLAAYGAEDDAAAAAAFLALQRDDAFTCQMRTWARFVQRGGGSAWIYRFARVPPHPDRDRYGAYHAAEIPYVFDTLGSWSFAAEARDVEVADLMSDLWVSFARDGRPSAEGVSWPAIDASTEPYLEIGDEVRVGEGLAEAACDLLDRVRSEQLEAAAAGAASSSGGAR